MISEYNFDHSGGSILLSLKYFIIHRTCEVIPGYEFWSLAPM